MAVDPQSYADSSGYISPNDPTARRKLFEAMLAQGLQSGPIGHWSQGAARLANAMIGGYGAWKAEDDERKGWQELGATLGASLPHPNSPTAGKPGADAPASASTPPPAPLRAPPSLSAPATGTSEPGTYPGVRSGTAFSDRWRSFLDDLRQRGVTIDPTQSGGYANRNIRGTNRPSLHASDQAYDVNWGANPEGSVQDEADIARQHLEQDMGGSTAPITQIHPMIARELAQQHGMRWGGDFTGRSPDPMHFEIAGGVPMAQRSITARAGMAPFPPPMRLGGPTEAETAAAGNPANDALIPDQQPLSAADTAAAMPRALPPAPSALPGSGGADPMIGPGPAVQGPSFLERLQDFANRYTPSALPAWAPPEGSDVLPPPEDVAARRQGFQSAIDTARGVFESRQPWTPPGAPAPATPTPAAPAAPTAAPMPGAPLPATSINRPLGTPTDQPGVTMASPDQPAPPGLPQTAPQPPAPATRPAPAPAVPQTAPATDVIRRLLQSRNPQAIRFGMQLYADMAKRGGTADYDFQAVEGTLYRINKRTGAAEVVAGSGGPRAPEAIRTNALRADASFRSISTLLDQYQRVVEQEGITAFPGQASDAVRQLATQIKLQLKELNNLGVLNGPDLELMNQLLTDTSLSPGNMLSNPAGRVGPSVQRLRGMLRVIRDNAIAAAGGQTQQQQPSNRLRYDPATGELVNAN